MSSWNVAEAKVPPFTSALAEHLASQPVNSAPDQSGKAPQASPQKQRRGPKAQTTPASSRLVERNRQAQRAHRHRKETYIKDLEREVARLRQVCANVSKERDSLAEQNATLLRRLDAKKGQWHSGASTSSLNRRQARGEGDTTTTSSTATYSTRQSDSITPRSSFDSATTQYSHKERRPSQRRLDYDAIGIDFVSTLERPCRKHIPYLHARAQYSTTNTLPHPDDVPHDDINLEISGHALMATCSPSGSDLMQLSTHSDNMPNIPTASLATLYGLSEQVFDLTTGELPPIKAWAAIRQDPRFPMFQPSHFKQLRDELYPHVVCLRFGAIIPIDVLDTALRNVDLTRHE